MSYTEFSEHLYWEYVSHNERWWNYYIILRIRELSMYDLNIWQESYEFFFEKGPHWEKIIGYYWISFFW